MQRFSSFDHVWLRWADLPEFLRNVFVEAIRHELNLEKYRTVRYIYLSQQNFRWRSILGFRYFSRPVAQLSDVLKVEGNLWLVFIWRTFNNERDHKATMWIEQIR